MGTDLVHVATPLARCSCANHQSNLFASDRLLRGQVHPGRRRHLAMPSKEPAVRDNVHLRNGMLASSNPLLSNTRHLS